ncbi:probable methyltransferase-like protein 25 [Topomyia yanbarensis]|uniref:probable methyltransferase-like protein 25 n=1 Tax=Topomyia yanbarensis TaxID=2498891 RepID=UPI00273CBA5A|nr:probable methyltransferase-like protein 25 [Topomyia yanbarensis]XP_058840744.1 probable methyltransferase-like protein 25 [Topomyia yanbarensis]
MELIRNHLEVLAEFLKPRMDFLNCHMVDYLTKDHWNTFIPLDIRNELNTSDDLIKAKQIFWNQFNGDYLKACGFPAITKHIQIMKRYRLDALPGACMALDDLKFAFNACLKQTRLRMPELMSTKKCHEVEIASAVVASLCAVVASKNSLPSLDQVAVVDAGDGKGYLSSRVALEHGIKVLGVDSNEGHTASAEQRRDRLKKKVRGAVKRSNLNNDDYFTTMLQDTNRVELNYKTTTKLIDFETDLIELVNGQFPDSSSSHFCLAGLHTCGNLGPNCLRLFHQNRHINALCNVGCCYHLLVEEFVHDRYYNQDKIKDNPGFGFPMSDCLRDKGFFLARNVRNMAGESLERSAVNQEDPSDKLGYRAMLQLVLRELKADEDSQVGKMKCKDFLDYTRKSLKRLQIDDSPISDEYLTDMEEKFEVELKQLKVFYLYRMTYAPVVEGLVLLDRLLYLKERGYDNSFLVKLFDPVVSPRCYSILAFK